MVQYIWLFPIIFIFHDMEEIIGLGIWLRNNKKMLEIKYPFILNIYIDFSTEGFAVAVFEELIVCILFCIFALVTNTKIMCFLWLGAFIACTIHFFIHIVQSLIIKQYIPATVTSIICFPISIYIILKCIIELNGNIINVLVSSFIGILIILINLKLAHSLIRKFTRKINL